MEMYIAAKIFRIDSQFMIWKTFIGLFFSSILSDHPNIGRHSPVEITLLDFFFYIKREFNMNMLHEALTNFGYY